MTPCESAESRPAEPAPYELTDDQKAALPAKALLAWAISRLDPEDPFDDPSNLTTALLAESGLEQEALVENNRALRHDEYTRVEVPLDDPTKLKLLLTPKGQQYLEEELGKVTED